MYELVTFSAMGSLLFHSGKTDFLFFFLRFSFVLFCFLTWALHRELFCRRMRGYPELPPSSSSGLKLPESSSLMSSRSQCSWRLSPPLLLFVPLLVPYLHVRCPSETVEEEKWCLLREGAAIEGSQTMTQRFLPLLVACNVLSDAIEITRLSRDISISIIIPELAECNSQWGTCFCVLALYTNNRTNRRVFFFNKKNCFSLHLSFKRLLTVFF